jgi:hypothetical protein
MGFQERPEVSAVDSMDDLVGQSSQPNLSASLMEETMDDFAGQFHRGPPHPETRENIAFAFRQISEGNFDALEELIRLLKTIRRGSGMLFQYYGVRPLVSRPMYGEHGSHSHDSGSEDSDSFEEVDPEVTARTNTQWWRYGGLNRD